MPNENFLIVFVSISMFVLTKGIFYHFWFKLPKKMKNFAKQFAKKVKFLDISPKLVHFLKTTLKNKLSHSKFFLQNMIGI
jgi:hypothetical protein